MNNIQCRVERYGGKWFVRWRVAGSRLFLTTPVDSEDEGYAFVDKLCITESKTDE